MPVWLIPMVYAGVSFICGLTLPQLEHAYFPTYSTGWSAASAQAFFSAVASGMIALTGIVFSIAFVMVQFSATAYSPRLVLLFARDPKLFHALGVFIATFLYALAALTWVDREATGVVPFFSVWVIVGLILASMLLFSQLIKRLSDLQITSVLHAIGNIGREVIRDTFDRPGGGRKNETGTAQIPPGEATQSLTYPGNPRIVAKLDIDDLVRQARQADATIVIACAVGDAVVHGTPLLRVYGAKAPLTEKDLMRAIRLEFERTPEQDPKYPLRLLVDIALRALSAAINDPTTAVQAIDQIEDLLRRLGRCEFSAGFVKDADGTLRLVFPIPSWDDYLTLAFDEIRQCGASSVQVTRRLRSVLVGLADWVTDDARARAVQRHMKLLDVAIDHSELDTGDQEMARLEDRQGLGVSRRRPDRAVSPSRPTRA